MTDTERPETFIFWLAAAARELREQSNARLEHVAAAADEGVHVVRRFEKGDTKTIPRNLDRLIAGYAQVAGVDNPRDIFEMALRMWREYGEPQDGRLTAAQKFDAAIAAGVQRVRSAQARPQRTRS